MKTIELGLTGRTAVISGGSMGIGRAVAKGLAAEGVNHNPAIFQAYLPYVLAIFAPGALDQRLKDQAAVRVAILNHCRYSVSHRVASSRKQGIPNEDLIGLLNPSAHNFSAAEQAALAFTEELTTQVDDISYADNRQGVSAETLQRLKNYFSDAEIAELAISAGLWNALTRFHRVMDFDLDMPEPPQNWMGRCKQVS